MVTDGGAPRCGECGLPLQFGTDRQGRTTEACACGYRGFVKTRLSPPAIATTVPPRTG